MPIYPYATDIGSQSLLIQGRFQHFKECLDKNNNPKVAIPFDPGQVSTKKTQVVDRVSGCFTVAIPFDPGQVSTLLNVYQAVLYWIEESQSLLIQGRFQQVRLPEGVVLSEGRNPF